MNVRNRKEKIIKKLSEAEFVKAIKFAKALLGDE
jgi:hypothetical protein